MLYRVVLTILTFIVIFSCNQKRDKQLNVSSNDGNYKIVPIATTTSNSDESKYQLISKVVNDLYKNGIAENSNHKLEFFFYCPTEEQAKKLTAHLKYMTYTAEYQHATENINNREFVVMGYTDPFPIKAGAIFGWSKAMSQIAEKYNSDFDGWQVDVKE